jgi:hypothetical protein
VQPDIRYVEQRPVDHVLSDILYTFVTEANAEAPAMVVLALDAGVAIGAVNHIITAVLMALITPKRLILPPCARLL